MPATGGNQRKLPTPGSYVQDSNARSPHVTYNLPHLSSQREIRIIFIYNIDGESDAKYHSGCKSSKFSQYYFSCTSSLGLHNRERWFCQLEGSRWISSTIK